jgi:hypothetical protein
MMNIAWKIGVNNQDRKLIGSAPGLAPVSGGAGVGDAAGPPGAPGSAQAATRRVTRTRKTMGTIRPQADRSDVTSWGPR